jgi:FtsH-binding integral membrane protein
VQNDFSLWKEDTMIRERALKVVMALVGLLFVAGLYAITTTNKPADQMLGVVYATLGVFLLLALRNTSANRSLIAFTAWSSLAHGAVMAVQAYRNLIPRADLVRAVLPLAIIGIALIALAPGKARMAGS